ncbi:MAG: hypothetical protein R2715_23520 [Ilumatobacteraceae bacterium]
MNIKDVVLTSTSDEAVAPAHARGPLQLTAGDTRPSEVEILNKDLHIATLNAKGRLVDLTVERGRGYLSSDRDIQNCTIGVVPIDADLRRSVANFEVEPTRVEQSTNLDRLIVDIQTDGSITPREGAGRAGRGDASVACRPRRRVVREPRA